MQDEEEQEEIFDFTAEGESLGYISLDQARRTVAINRQSLARSASQGGSEQQIDVIYGEGAK